MGLHQARLLQSKPLSAWAPAIGHWLVRQPLQFAMRDSSPRRALASGSRKRKLEHLSPAASPVEPKAKAAKPAEAQPSGPWLLVGLGNPGPRYERTRHNIGFIVIDALAKEAGISLAKLEKSAAVGKGTICGQQVLLAKPVTFMNNSGESVAALARFHKVPQQQILVVSDDLDQPTAAVKLKPKGGHGGHNGLRSIIQHLGGSHEFPRLKIGIGRPTGDYPVASYVLEEFNRSEAAAVEAAVEDSLRIIKAVLQVGLEKALSGVKVS